MGNVTCWIKGGNAITNFDQDARPVYELAIKRYAEIAPGEKFWIDEAMPDVYGRERPDAYSLCTSDKCDKSKFWQVWRQAKKDLGFKYSFE
jgi:hypothetical protein